MENEATTNKADKEKDPNTKEEDLAIGKVVETNETKVQSSPPPLVPKISFPYRFRK